MGTDHVGDQRPGHQVEVVVYEDRPAQLMIVKLLVASLARHTPSLHVSVVAPGSDPEFRSWVQKRPTADIVELDTGAATGWDVKAGVLTAMLDRGHQQVAWLDSDIIVGRDALPALSRAPGALLATEEVWYARGRVAGRSRTEAWGLVPGRLPAHPLNTAVVRVDDHHRPLLARWRELLARPEYQFAQTQRIVKRPAHLFGDQDVLDALRGSQEFEGLQVQLLRRGSDIAQCLDAAGFSPTERLRVRLATRVPVFVHAMGAKPWNVTRADWNATAAALSPYTALAADYAEELGDELRWTRPTTRLASLAVRVTGGDPVLRQLGPSIVQSANWHARKVVGEVRRRRGAASS